MNFGCFKREDTRFTFIEPLRMGGSQGIIAQHIALLQSDYNRIRWLASAQELLKLKPIENADTIVFTNTGDAHLFYFLESIVGISSEDETELVLRMRVMKGSQDADGTIIAEASPESQRVLCESMILTGGYRRGTWKWCEPPMGIGAAIV